VRINNDNYNALVGRNSVKESLKINTLTYWDENEIERGIIYDKILKDLEDLNYTECIIELENKLNNGDNINDILISIITKNDDTKSTLGYHQNIIQHYLNQDFIKLFE